MAPQTPLKCPWRGCRGSVALAGSRLTHSGCTGHGVLSLVTGNDASLHPFCVVSPGGTDTGPGQTWLPFNHDLGFAASSTEGKRSYIVPEMQAVEGNHSFPLERLPAYPRHSGAIPVLRKAVSIAAGLWPVVCAHRSWERRHGGCAVAPRRGAARAA